MAEERGSEEREKDEAEQEGHDEEQREREQQDDGGEEQDDAGDEQDDAGDEQEGDDEQPSRPSISAREMTQAAMEALKDLTGHTPEAATGLMYDGGSWLVTVDVLELSRIPNTTDLLATYVVQLDGDGNLSGYKRTKRFQRAQAEDG